MGAIEQRLTTGFPSSSARPPNSRSYPLMSDHSWLVLGAYLCPNLVCRPELMHLLRAKYALNMIPIYQHVQATRQGLSFHACASTLIIN